MASARNRKILNTAAIIGGLSLAVFGGYRMSHGYVADGAIELVSGLTLNFAGHRQIENNYVSDFGNMLTENFRRLYSRIVY